ncbi:MAG TPA: hypothetical protein VKK79_08940 [Candidatus Lokiarchaeia archaeon]|nr:hypothetical protein [Candidatus Lokiarchaeia archaeon]
MDGAILPDDLAGMLGIPRESTISAVAVRGESVEETFNETASLILQGYFAREIKNGARVPASLAEG